MVITEKIIDSYAFKTATADGIKDFLKRAFFALGTLYLLPDGSISNMNARDGLGPE